MKAVVYNDPDERTAWAPHVHYAYYVDRAPYHYRFKTFWMTDTKQFCHAVGKIYHAHCKTPKTSIVDLFIITTTNLVKSMQAIVPPLAKSKCRHTKILPAITSILENSKPMRVDTSGQPRVSPNPEAPAMTSTDVTAPRVIFSTRYVHKRRTRNNIPMPITFETDGLLVVDDDETIVAGNTSNSRLSVPDLPKVMY